MRPEQLKIGAKVYRLETGDLYELIDGGGNVWIREHLGRRGERSGRAATATEWLLRDFALWCSTCDGTGKLRHYTAGTSYTTDCPDCKGEGLIP
jgi:hypothetical protein